MARSGPSRNRDAATLRIIGGRQRGRRIYYNGDPSTRPMKDRVREAVFNLVGPSIKGTHAIDLFAGTGAVALEALSRGAIRATALERNFEMVRLIEQNAAGIGLQDRIQVVPGNTFLWTRKLFSRMGDLGSGSLGLGSGPWSVFCCPPYALYEHQLADMVELLDQFQKLAPVGSIILAEADTPFDFARLPQPDRWDVRSYAPAQVGIMRIGE